MGLELPLDDGADGSGDGMGIDTVEAACAVEVSRISAKQRDIIKLDVVINRKRGHVYGEDNNDEEKVEYDDP